MEGRQGVALNPAWAPYRHLLCAWNRMFPPWEAPCFVQICSAAWDEGDTALLLAIFHHYKNKQGHGANTIKLRH